jgi:hypothetical protein
MRAAVSGGLAVTGLLWAGLSAPTAVAQEPGGTNDLAGLAAVALPGTLGLLALTGLGGVLGYRQAKAGRALRTAASARFLGGG